MKKNESEKWLKEVKELPHYQLTIEQHRKIASRLQMHQVPHFKRESRLTKRIAVLVLICTLSLGTFLVFLSMQKAEQERTASYTEPVHGKVFDRIGKDGEIITKDGLYGIPGKAGFMSIREWVAEDKANISKQFIFLWGEDLPGKQVKITATQGENEVEVADVKVTLPLDSEDAHTLTSFNALPYPGEWLLTFIVDDKDFAKFTVQVKEAYPQSGPLIIRHSGEDFYTGTVEDVIIEYKGEELPDTLSVKIKPSIGFKKAETLTFSNKTDYMGATTYTGKLSFNRAGSWQIEVNGEKMHIKVKDKQ